MTETRTTLKIVTSNRTTPAAGRTHLPLTDGAQIRPKPKLLDQLCETLQHDQYLHSRAQQGRARRAKPNGWIMSVLIQSVYIGTPQSTPGSPAIAPLQPPDRTDLLPVTVKLLLVDS